jgi:hypothetical protein
MENKESVACYFAQSNNDFSRASHTRVFVCPTTGGKLELSVSASETIQGLKYFISRKLRILIYADETRNMNILEEKVCITIDVVSQSIVLC